MSPARIKGAVGCQLSGYVQSDAAGSRPSVPTATSLFGAVDGFADMDDLGDVGVGFDVAEPAEVDPTTVFEE